ncbi:MAG TPA: VOC family protein [Puia sp.]|nr:VOC family protein [Puia sp.]
MRFHHVGIACGNIEAETQRLAAIHEIVKKSPVILDKAQNAELILLTLADGTQLELVAGPQVEIFLKRKISYYHLCFEVEDIHAEIARLLATDAILLSPPKPAPLFDNREVAFLHVSYGMIELLSQK